MAWTNPSTWANGDVPTAANFNAQIRDNLNETMPGKASSSGQVFYASGAKAIAALTIGSSGQYLTASTAGLPSWAALAGGLAVTGSGYTTLTDDVASATATWEQWGTEEATVTNPGGTKQVTAWLRGEIYVNNGGATKLCKNKIQISLDGGTSWSTGPEKWESPDRTLIDQRNVSCVFRVSGSVTGDIQARAMLNQANGTAGQIDWRDGALMVEVIPG